MACSACSSLMASDLCISPSSARRLPPALATAVLPRRQAMQLSSSAPLFGIARRGVAARERDLRAMAVVKKYKGTRMKEKRLEQMIEQKVMEAKMACEGDEASDECKVAWDEVEEVSKAKANLRRRLAESGRDPLESFCLENPETDECSVVDDDDD